MVPNFLSAAACSAHISKVRALRVIVIAFLTAIAGGILSVAASLYLTELYLVSNFEGGRGMLIFFALAPLGLVVGFIVGLIVALRSRGAGFGGFAKATGNCTRDCDWTRCSCFRYSLSCGRSSAQT